jgi:prephenate dehydratase
LEEKVGRDSDLWVEMQLDELGTSGATATPPDQDNTVDFSDSELLREAWLTQRSEKIQASSKPSSIGATRLAQLAKEDKNSAAICSEVAAKLYNLPVLFRNIENDNNNKTRFFVISDFENRPSGSDKTTIIAKLPNRPGALVDFLLDFKAHNIDLTKIKSHIVGGISIFFLEFNGHKSDKDIEDIFNKHKDSIKFLGSYVKEADDV